MSFRTAVTFLVISLVCTSIVAGESRQDKKARKDKETQTAHLQKTNLSTDQKDDAGRFIDSIKSRSENVFWGEGIAAVGEDLGEAKVKAKARAQKDLSEKITMSVRSEITRVLKADSKSVLQDELTEKITVYTNAVINNPEEKYLIDYPSKGNIDYVIYINRKTYEEKVKNDLDAKKTMIREAIRNGNEEFKNNNYMSALNGWLTGKEYLGDFFGNLPLEDDLDGDNRLEEVNSYIHGKVTGFFGNLQASFMNDTIVYDVNGRPSRQPVALVYYRNEKGAKQPVANIPLVIRFVEGKGSSPEGLVTGAYGQIQIALSEMVSGGGRVGIIASIDKSAIKGLDEYKLPEIQSAPFTMNKIRTVAVCVASRPAGEGIASEEILNEIYSRILDRKLTAIKVSVAAQTPLSPEELDNAAKSNADFLLTAVVEMKCSGGVGGYSNMYTASCSGAVSLYDLAQRKILATEQLPSSKGFGTTASGAGWDAFAKIKKAVIGSADEVIDKIP